MNRKILIVDDEKTFRESLQEILQNNGYQVALAADCLTALDLIQQDVPDLLIVDVLIPRMHGLELCARLKKDARLSQIPIILTSGVYKDLNFRLHLSSNLADDFIAKPFKEQEILKKITRLLD